MVCVVCGKEIETDNYMHGDNGTYIHEGCFKEWFWRKTLNPKTNPIIIDGNCYHVEDENDNSYFRGFAGRSFTIQMDNGKVIHTTNLWHQGEVPKEFYTGDNAKFVD